MALLIRAAALFAAVTSIPASPVLPQTVKPEPTIPLVMCPIDSEHGTAGTAFRISPHLLLSVDHVTSGKNCEIDGVPITILYASPKADFSILSDNRAGGWLRVDCNGFVAGRKYYAVGHARGADELTVVPLVATGDNDHGQAILAGIFTVQPGQSGGAVIDAETHQVVGTINTGDWEDGFTGSVELKGTSICKGNIA